ncbi:hypothetical protein CCACVL1_06052 [Corchorus capsularis]|uniref:Uncharacterized protein n=1 Tax=Corchorus capsularis TaxID=210143 RepID=A0A1R3JHK5_COCAP|nr:hypothetical protein CCACVL1_06052 [Corchorus capsularis]
MEFCKQEHCKHRGLGSWTDLIQAH